MGESGGKVILRDESGRELKVPHFYLRPDDIEYLDSRIVPILRINPGIKVNSEFQSEAGVVQVVQYAIEDRKISSESYNSPVNNSL